MDCCREGYALGYRTFVLQSGEDLWYTVDKLKDIIVEIKKLFPDAAVTLSRGEKKRYRAFLKQGRNGIYFAMRQRLEHCMKNFIQERALTIGENAFRRLKRSGIR